MKEPLQPLTAALAAQQWALDLLHGVAAALEEASRAETADALQQLASPLRELEQVAARVLVVRSPARPR